MEMHNTAAELEVAKVVAHPYLAKQAHLLEEISAETLEWSNQQQ